MTTDRFDADSDAKDKTDIDVLHEIGSRIAAADPFHGVLGRVVDFVASVVPCDSCLVPCWRRTIRPGTEDAASGCDRRLEMRVGQGITGWSPSIASRWPSGATPSGSFASRRSTSCRKTVQRFCLCRCSRAESSSASSTCSIVSRRSQPPGHSTDLHHRISCRRRNRDGAARGRKHSAVRRLRDTVGEREENPVQRDLGVTEEEAYLTIQRQSRQRRKSKRRTGGDRPRRRPPRGKQA